MQNFQHIPLPQSLLTRFVLFFIVTAGYFLLSKVGLSITNFNQYAPPVWIASGFAVGIATLFGRSLIPAIFVGAFLAMISANNDISFSALISFTNALEAFVGSTLIISLFRKNYFKNYNEFFAITIGAVISALIGSTLANIIQYYSGAIPPAEFLRHWVNWWTGDTVKILIILPLVMEICKRSNHKIKLTPIKIILGTLLSLFCFLCLYLVLVKGVNQAFSWALCPVFILIGLILGKRYSRIMLILVSLFTAKLTSMGHGPFGQGDYNLNLVFIESNLASFSFAILFVGPLQSSYKVSIKYLVSICLGWILLFTVIYSISFYEKRNAALDFKKTTSSAVENLKSVSNQYEILLSGAAGLYRSKQDLSQEQWKNYVRSMKTENILKSIRGLGLVTEVSKNDRKQFEDKHGPIKTINSEYSQKFNNHYVVQYIEPTPLLKWAKGLDLGSEERRREAVERTIKMRKTTATKPIMLQSEKVPAEGFLVFHPVISDKNEFIGLTYTSVIESIFFGQIFSNISHLVKVKVTMDGEDAVIYDNSPTTRSYKRNRFYEKKDFSLFGTDYNFEFYPTSLFFSRHSGTSTFVALLLNVLMLFISVFLLDQMTLGQRAEALAAKRSKELENSRLQLINASKMASLGEMASGLAHEINNPLAIIQGKIKVISLIMEDLNIKDQSLHQEFGKIKLTTDRIEKIIKGLRNFSRSSTNDPFESVSLKRIMNETFELCGEKLKSEGIELKMRSIPGLNILCRSSQITQVMINLLNNSSDAIELMKDKWIDIQFDVVNDKLSISFTDSGKGIPAEVAEKIMEPFFTTKAVSKGTGLGLSITKSIIESHNGNFWLDTSHPNTRFIIELPLEPHQIQKYYQLS